MKIYKCKDYSEKVQEELKNLLPQLCSNCESPTQKKLESIIRNKNNYLFLAEKDEIIGTLTLVITETLSGKKAWIEDVIVDANYRGLGIGKALIEYAIRVAQDLQISKIDLTSNPKRKEANNLYKSMGFQPRKTNVYRIIL